MRPIGLVEMLFRDMQSPQSLSSALPALLCALVACQSSPEPDPSDATPGPSSAEWIVLGVQEFSGRNYEDATLTFEKAARAAEREDDRDAQAEAYALWANGYFARGLLDEGWPLLQRAAGLARPEEPRSWSRYLGVRGRYERQRGELETSLATFQDMYSYCREQGLYERAIDAAHMAALVAPPQEQIEWAYRGIEAAEEGGHEDWLGPLWNNLGWTLDDLGRHEESLAALKQARHYHDRVGDELARLIAEHSVGHGQRMTGDLETAAETLLAVLAWAERRHAEQHSPETAEWVGMSHWELGELALQRAEPVEALEHLELARGLLLEAGIDDWGTDLLAELDASLERARAAVQR